MINDLDDMEVVVPSICITYTIEGIDIFRIVSLITSLPNPENNTEAEFDIHMHVYVSCVYSYSP